MKFEESLVKRTNLLSVLGREHVSGERFGLPGMLSLGSTSQCQPYRWQDCHKKDKIHRLSRSLSDWEWIWSLCLVL